MYLSQQQDHAGSPAKNSTLMDQPQRKPGSAHFRGKKIPYSAQNCTDREKLWSIVINASWTLTLNMHNVSPVKASATFLHSDFNASLTGADQWLICLNRLVKQLDQQRARLLVLIPANCRDLFHTYSCTHQPTDIHVTSQMVKMNYITSDLSFSSYRLQMAACRW